jgi:hypothetical protein
MHFSVAGNSSQCRHFSSWHKARTSARAARASATVPENVASAQAWISRWRMSQTPSRAQLWRMCLKVPMYSVGLAPMAVGAALAYYATGYFAAAVCRDLLLGSILIIAWLNVRCDLDHLPWMQQALLVRTQHFIEDQQRSPATGCSPAARVTYHTGDDMQQ